jgi:arylsulfatase B
VAPTLLAMAGVKKPDGVKFDGVSVRALLDPMVDVDWADRFLVTDSQRVRDPIKWRKSAVMSQRWRLVNGTELYDIAADPGQKNDIAKDHPEQVETMREFYEDWWAELEPTFAQTTEIYLGHEEAKVAVLTAHDWISNGGVPWNQGHIRRGPGGAKKGRKGGPPRKLAHDGHWAVKVVADGTYKISARRWPVESDQAINAALPAGADVPGASKAFRAQPGAALGATVATLRIDGKDLESKPLSDGAKEVSFTTTLTKGSHQLAPVFVVPNGEVGAYYAVVEKVK